MNTRQFYNATSHDFNIDPGFVEECRDHSIPISVIGNGGSLSTLNNVQINELNQTRLFRCNWAFDDPGKIKKRYAIYFAQAFNGTMEQDFTESCKQASYSGKFIWYRFQKNVVYDFSLLNSVLEPGGFPVWPTTGIQMLLTAAFLIPCPEINIAGLDMYTYNRDKIHMTKKELNVYMKQHGKTFSRSPNNSAGTTLFKSNLTYVTPKQFVDTVQKKKATFHYIEIDILILLKIFIHCITQNKKINFYNCDMLQNIHNTVQQNQHIVTEYFKLTDQTFYNIQYIPAIYNMWRLINKIMDQVLPE